MSKVLILGANGQIARLATAQLLTTTDAKLTLYLRQARRLRGVESRCVRVVEGDVLDAAKLREAMTGQDVVYANLAGQLEPQAQAIVEAMGATGLKRLIFVSSMGIYDEVPGETFGRVLDPYRASATIIEASDLDYTLVRPAWFTDDEEIDYETTNKGEPFRGSVVSKKSVADLIVKLVQSPSMAIRGSLGVARG
jgi:uncharacterized protein YbjT (DUF2867 family)